MNLTIYHNPRCSKSRQTLALLKERGLDPDIVLYLEQAPSRATLKSIIKALGVEPRQLMRKGEALYRELGLGDEQLTTDQLVEAMSENPILIERPIVTKNGKAALGRPPESVLAIL